MSYERFVSLEMLVDKMVSGSTLPPIFRENAPPANFNGDVYIRMTCIPTNDIALTIDSESKEERGILQFNIFTRSHKSLINTYIAKDTIADFFAQNIRYQTGRGHIEIFGPPQQSRALYDDTWHVMPIEFKFRHFYI